MQPPNLSLAINTAACPSPWQSAAHYASRGLSRPLSRPRPLSLDLSTSRPLDLSNSRTLAHTHNKHAHIHTRARARTQASCWSCTRHACSNGLKWTARAILRVQSPSPGSFESARRDLNWVVIFNLLGGDRATQKKALSVAAKSVVVLVRSGLV